MNGASSVPSFARFTANHEVKRELDYAHHERTISPINYLLMKQEAKKSRQQAIEALRREHALLEARERERRPQQPVLRAELLAESAVQFL